ncbi:TPA: hypothetical protein N0F65_002859 [Lagenidium giganteum]|uniref:EGF-like domain-containing protein n=1 Tax=Lagenidium giganteum TaxID=4803 RepID=A0AAV2ZAV4_9STRA|nr:TPA: hypothetical protein N0F65_002859 [Lagenidium giganteum]
MLMSMHRKSCKRNQRWVLWNVMLWMVVWVVNVNGAMIGFSPQFTSSLSPVSIVRTDATCSIPGTVILTLKVERSGDLNTADSVQLSTRNTSSADVLSAVGGADYSQLINHTISFAVNESIQEVNISILSDGEYKDDQQFEVVLHSPSAHATIDSSNDVAYISIQDGGNAGIFLFSASNYSFSEAAGIVKLKIVRRCGTSNNVTVQYRIANAQQSTATSGKNFVMMNSSMSVDFVEGQGEGYVFIKIVNDAVYDPASNFFFVDISALSPMKASDPTQSIAKVGTPRTVAVFIMDDGDAGEFNFASPYVVCREDNSTAYVSVVRSVGWSTSPFTPIKLSLTTVGPSGGSNATDGGSSAFDYMPTSDTQTWADGEKRKTFAVTIFNNNRYDSKTRAFKVQMVSVVGGASIGMRNETWVYIIDDRDAGTLSFAKPHYTVLENATKVTVDVVRMGLKDPTGVNNYSSVPVSVDVATYGLAILPGRDKYDDAYDYEVVSTRGCTHFSPCTATAGIAYEPISSKTLSFNTGELSKSVTILITDNNLFEAPTPVFKVILRNVTGGAHLGIDFEHPEEWKYHEIEFLAADRRQNELMDNVGTIVSILDDGDPALLVTKATLSVSEIGQADSIQLSLNSKPTGDVHVNLTTTSSLALNPPAVIFNMSNWAQPQQVEVTAYDNSISEGIHQILINISSTSSDPAYSNPIRKDLASNGFVLAENIYSPTPGVFSSGDPFHAFLWEERSGVLTAPIQTPSVSAFVLDDDHSGIVLTPESVRHSASQVSPNNFVCVRHQGRNAVVGLRLMSEPRGRVRVDMKEIAGGSNISVTPSFVEFQPNDWNKSVSISIASLAPLKSIIATKVEFFLSSSTDPVYNHFSTRDEVLFVTIYPNALVLLDTSPLVVQENDNSARPTYSLGIGSEPMYWEPPGSNYIPFQLGFSPDADTTLVFGSTKLTSQTTITIASNSSLSTANAQVSTIGVIRFPVMPDILKKTGGNQVGHASLQLYRLSGGENNGLGGIIVGASLVTSSGEWNETKLRVYCSSPTTLDTCAVMNGNMSIPSFFPEMTSYHNISSATSGEAKILPLRESFNTTINKFDPSPGWVEIDITAAVNSFISKQLQVPSTNRSSITLLLYTRSIANFTYDGVDEVVFASREHPTSAFHPQLVVIGSGRINLSGGASVDQSHPGSASAAIDGDINSVSDDDSTFAMSTSTFTYPWWEADLGAPRAIEDIRLVIKKKALSAFMSDSDLQTAFWVMLSNETLSKNNKGLNGFQAAKANAKRAKRFEVTTRSFTASESEKIIYWWRVNGEDTGEFVYDRFASNFNSTAGYQFVLLQVEGENNIMLNEIEIYQQAMASTRVSVGGYMPSPSVLAPNQNQLEFLRSNTEQDDPARCDARGVCRTELLFTSGNWNVSQVVNLTVKDDNVASGDRSIALTHTLVGMDPDYHGSTVCTTINGSQSVVVSPPCSSKLFNETSIKTLQAMDDDVNWIQLSKSSLDIVEGSLAFPGAPVLTEFSQIMPLTYQCSQPSAAATSVTVVAPTKPPAACSSSFNNATDATWTVCIANTSSSPLRVGSAWMLAGLPDGSNVTEVRIRVLQMASVKYVRKFSVWQNGIVRSSDPPSSLLNLTNGWESLGSYELALKTTGSQDFIVSNLVGTSSWIMVAFHSSFDDANQCLVAPKVTFYGYRPMPFPLPIRGDITSPLSVPPLRSLQSRMHLAGSGDEIIVQLSSEPVSDIIIWAQLDASSTILVFNPVGGSNLQAMTGATYESGETHKFLAVPFLRFSSKNWNVPQVLRYLVTDDNTYIGDRTLTIKHVAISNESTQAVIPVQTFHGDTLTYSTTAVSSALRYTKAQFVTGQSRASSWPFHPVASTTSPDGSVQVHITDDDLPGITLSQSQVVVIESGPVGNYSISLDSAPTSDVIISISYTKDDSLMTVSPQSVKFERATWFQPQWITINPTPNNVYDGGAPFTAVYDRYIPKAKQPILAHVAQSRDPNYNGISIGQNENDTKTAYVVAQGLRVIVLDDDTGCLGEYSCANGGSCVSAPTGNVCVCPSRFGLKNCSANCDNERDCVFSRVQFQVKCVPSDPTAVCSDSFSASRMISTLYRMVTTTEVVAADGTKFPKLTLGPMADVLYVVNSTTSSTCGSAQGTCVSVWVEVSKPAGASSDIAAKLRAYAEAGSLKQAPLFIELVTVHDAFPKTVGARVAVWVFIGFCGCCVAGVGLLFARKVMLRPHVSHVMPEPANGGAAWTQT